MEISPYEEEEGWRQAQVSAPKYNDVMSMRFKSQAVFLNRSCVRAILMPMNFSCHLDLPMNFACNLDAYELFVQS